jgi:hypothetical protein
MITLKKSYVLELTENQARQLYNLIHQDKFSFGSQYDDLGELYTELKKLFDTGVR